jgi:flavin reductase (DIM6/NTAB) family NADH-FMN oxidoreductase RutF
VDRFPGGDHSIFVGEVLSGSAREDTDPLLYFRGGYRQLG